MPLNARQYLDLALLTPRSALSAGTQGGGFNVSGLVPSPTFFCWRCQQHRYANQLCLGNFRITDAVQEFAVQTSVATAEFGRGTGDK